MEIRKIFSKQAIETKKKTVSRQCVTQAEKSMSFRIIASVTEFASYKPIMLSVVFERVGGAALRVRVAIE